MYLELVKSKSFYLNIRMEGSDTMGKNYVAATGPDNQNLILLSFVSSKPFSDWKSKPCRLQQLKNIEDKPLESVTLRIS